MAHHQENFHEQLESNDKEVVERLKQTIREQFAKVSDPWLINGLYDYFMNTNSVRGMEMILSLRHPHQFHLFDRMYDTIKNPKNDLNTRVQALTLLGYIACSQTTSWLISLPDHPLFKQILKLLNTETELLSLVSALLLLIVLLPRFPAHIGQYYLDDIFNIFLRLAGWNSSVSGQVGEDQIIHLQVALYALFLRLYGMYPCNFLLFLRTHFKDKNDPIFCHTIKPMIDTVKMHPCLVTTSKESEITTERWIRKAPHDVIVECERLSLDITDRCSHESCQNTMEFRSRSGTMNSTVGSGTTSSMGSGLPSEFTYQQQNIKELASFFSQPTSFNPTFFSPSQFYQVKDGRFREPARVTPVQIQNATSRSFFPISQEGSPPEAAIEATPETTPVRDFTEPPAPQPSRSNVARALTSFRSVPGIISGTPTNSVPSSPLRKDASLFVFPAPSSSNLSQNLAHRLALERQGSELQSKPPPSSPLKIISSEPPRQRPESPVSQEDEEVSSISVTASHTEATKKCVARQCDSVLPDSEDSSDKNGEEQETEHGSPCAAGGLHMPNSKSINSFKNRIRRFRYHSQCNPEIDHGETSTGSSPGNGFGSLETSTVRRANSCPDMKKSLHASLPKDCNKKPFYETDEEIVSEDHSNGVAASSALISKPPTIHSATQTEVFWPMPYEHLFLLIFPSLRDDLTEVKTTAKIPTPGTALHRTIEPNRPSLYDLLDKYVEGCAAAENQNSKDQVQLIQDQVKLLQQQLLFERHRRETHAYKNRTLLSNAKNIRLLEEHNSALRDQVQLEQKEIDELRLQVDICRREVAEERRIMEQTEVCLEEKCKRLIEENITLKDTASKLQAEMASYKIKYNSIDKERQEAEAVLMDALAEGKIAKDQAMAGEKYKEQLQQANRELLLAGELNTKLRDRLEQLTSRGQTDEEMRQISEAYREELKSLQRQINAKSVTMEAYRARIADLEHSLAAKDELFVSQKRALTTISEEHAVMMEAVESKYNLQLAINRSLEERILELRMKFEGEVARRRTNSPDTSSCHEVRTTPTATSPLSASLASSDGSAIMHEARSLQMNVDQEGSSKTGACATDEPTNQGKND